MKNKKKKTLIIFSVISGLLLFAMCFVAYGKYVGKTDNRPIVTKITMDDCPDNLDNIQTCKKYLTVDNKNIDIVISTKKYQFFEKNEDFDYLYGSVKINGKTVFEHPSNSCLQISELESYNDLIIISSDMYCGLGADAPKVVISPTGEVLLNFIDMDLGPSLTYNKMIGDANPGEFEISGNKIIFTRHNDYIKDNLNEEYVQLWIDNKLIEVTAKNYNDYSEVLCQKTLEFEYLGNNEFSQKVVKETTFGEMFSLEYFKSDLPIEEELFHGVAKVEGYVTIEKRRDCRRECMDDIEETEEVDYVLFHILKTDNKDLLKYIEDFQGNSFVGKEAIGLGCVKNGILTYYNDSDAKGEQEYSLSKSNTAKITSSTKQKPLTLELEKLLFTGGSMAPTCSSHITTIKIP